MRDMRHGRGEDPRDEMGDYPANRHNQSGSNHSSSNVSSTKKVYTSSIYCSADFAALISFWTVRLIS